MRLPWDTLPAWTQRKSQPDDRVLKLSHEGSQMRKKSRIALYGLSLLVGAGLAAAAACSAGPGPSPTPSTPPTASGVSFTKDIQPVFNANCVVCHQGAQGRAGLSLQANAAYNNLVNAKSSESSLLRVAPGAPDKSYLVNKLMGTQGPAGGSGAQMPFGAPPLSQAQISLMQQWISQGAPNN